MNGQTFSLQPFHKSESSEQKIIVRITRNIHHFTIRYVLIGNLQDVAIAPLSDTPVRKHELWADTCFEFFLGIPNSTRYWEFNLSPSGNWNVYRFDGYRQGMQEETAFTQLPFSIQSQSDSLTLTLDIDLEPIISQQPLKIGVTAVINLNNQLTYWALTHVGTEADFHLRDSFMIQL
ncbi:MAG: DOMON-like domain-containing protein [Nostocaceae cyanobacterium]|nr:DOMON-like domain-containing protein [Nostocaceae cyanobacterium]